jgi:hypothetical protein
VDHRDPEVAEGHFLTVSEVPVRLEIQSIGIKAVYPHRRFRDVSHFLCAAGMVKVKMGEKNVSYFQPQPSDLFYNRKYLASGINDQTFSCFFTP